jgi:2-succinyl-5-enolpyruvyl-6-hydroxy-3-cyclohexene-1-carboxylate synthase
MTSSPATEWSRAFFGALIAQGVRDVVVSPGARSQALALAALEWEQSGELNVHVVIDERSAAFRALGLSMESQVPAVCIATSGSAPAHYYPAVMEAHHAGVGLIVVSADRPHELQGVGANQSTQQSGLFGFAAPSWDTEATGTDDARTARGVGVSVAHHAARFRPAHVNVAFREPLSSSEPTEWAPPRPIEDEAGDREKTVLSLSAEPGTLVVAGHGAGVVAEVLAVSLGAPLIAEVVSGSRFGPHLVLAYREVLNQAELPGPVHRVITVGRPTLSREVWAVLENPSLVHIVLRGSEAYVANPTREAQIVDSIDVSRPATAEQRSQWVKPWVMAARKLYEATLSTVLPARPDWGSGDSDGSGPPSAFAQQEMNVLRRPVTRPELALAVWEASWPHDRLVLGASRMIREMDQIVGSKNIRVYSNRGLSGIDGTISTARGIASAAARAGASGVTRVVLGDLAFLHDAGSLLVEPGVEDLSRVHLFVANDGGGTIFDALEVSKSAPQKVRDRVLYTPQEADFEALAKAYGWDYVTVNTRGELSDALVRSDARLIVDIALQR